jgi:hypothetical protein
MGIEHDLFPVLREVIETILERNNPIGDIDTTFAEQLLKEETVSSQIVSL